MRTPRQAVLGLLVASLCALACAPGASASRLSVNAETWRAAFSSMTAAGGSGAISIRCPTTLEGEFDPVFTKTAGGVIGSVYESELNRGGCTGGSPSVLHETLPEDSTYVSFSGTLPIPTSFTFAFPGLSYRTEVFGLPCLYLSTRESPAKFSMNMNSSGEVTSIRAVETASIPIVAGGEGLCPRSITLSGTGTVTVLETGGTYRVTLVESTTPLPNLLVEPRIAVVRPGREISNVVRIVDRENVDIETREVVWVNNTAFSFFENDCENTILRQSRMNFCRISTFYERTEAERPRLATIKLRYIYNGQTRSINILTFARKP